MLNGLVKTIPKEDRKKAEGRFILLARHGETALNASGKPRAWTNVSLNTKGVNDAQKLGRYIRDKSLDLDGIIVSDMLRTQQTALEIAKITEMPILRSIRDLRPWDIGTLVEKTDEEARVVMKDYAWNRPDEPVGEIGESFESFKMRSLLGVVSMLNSYRGLRLCFVSHSRLDRVVKAWMANDCNKELEVDLDEFFKEGIEPGTAEQLIIDSPLVLS